MSAMRILLRQEQTRLYFQQPDSWVDDAAHAYCFEGSVEAERLARERGFKNVEVSFEFDTPGYNFAVPLGPA